MLEPYNSKYLQWFVFNSKKEVAQMLNKSGFELVSYSTEAYKEEGGPFVFSFVYAQKA